jgi:hypothetical protein
VALSVALANVSATLNGCAQVSVSTRESGRRASPATSASPLVSESQVASEVALRSPSLVAAGLVVPQRSQYGADVRDVGSTREAESSAIAEHQFHAEL